MTARIMVDGVAANTVSALDRGLAYGDGLFETVLLVEGRAPLWTRHMTRLADGCARLHLPPPDPERLWREGTAVAADLARAVLRISLTRGVGERGYAPPAVPRPTRIVCAMPAPVAPADWYDEGIRVHLCSTRLAVQPALAGLKHLNRLEQVLARAEWDDTTIGEGLMCDTDDYVVCATAANLFAVRDGRLLTPPLDRCGVAGVARAEVLARCADAIVERLRVEDLMRADEIFLTSSVRGIVPVRALPQRALGVGPRTRALQEAWRAQGLLPRVRA